MHEFILKRLPSLSSFGPWLSRRGVLYAGVAGFAAAILFITLGIIPSDRPDATVLRLPFWKAIYAAGFPLAFMAFWLVATQSYLRTGRGTKIGLAYDGHAVDVADWKRTCDTLRDLLMNGEIRNLVALRFVPFSIAKAPERADEFMKKYGFAILTAVQESPGTRGAQKGKHQRINLRILSKAEQQQFLKTTLQHYSEILRRRGVGDSLIEVLDAQARNLYDMMLLFVASHLYLTGKYRDAAAILKHLDNLLSVIMRADERPRTEIRWLDMNCRLREAEFRCRAIPEPAMISDIRKFAESALCYFDDSPAVPIALARIRFFDGDVQGAIELTDRFLQKIAEVKKAGQEISDKAWVCANLNHGFLSFIQGHWVNAAKAYSNMLARQAYAREDWNIIIEFADYVADLGCFEGTRYLQVLYRLLAQKPVPTDLLTGAQDWVNTDDSRRELNYLLRRNYASLPMQARGISTAAMRQNGKSNSKPKRKPGKHRRRKR